MDEQTTFADRLKLLEGQIAEAGAEVQRCAEAVQIAVDEYDKAVELLALEGCGAGPVSADDVEAAEADLRRVERQRAALSRALPALQRAAREEQLENSETSLIALRHTGEQIRIAVVEAAALLADALASAEGHVIDHHAEASRYSQAHAALHPGSSPIVSDNLPKWAARLAFDWPRLSRDFGIGETALIRLRMDLQPLNVAPPADAWAKSITPPSPPVRAPEMAPEIPEPPEALVLEDEPPSIAAARALVGR